MTKYVHISAAFPAGIGLVRDMINLLCNFKNDTYHGNPDAITHYVFGTQAGACLFSLDGRAPSWVVHSDGMNLISISATGVCVRKVFTSMKSTLKTGARRQMMRYLGKLAAS